MSDDPYEAELQVLAFTEVSATFRALLAPWQKLDSDPEIEKVPSKGASGPAPCVRAFTSFVQRYFGCHFQEIA